MVEGKKEKKRLARREFLGTGAVLAAGALSASASVAQGTQFTFYLKIDDAMQDLRATKGKKHA